MVLHGPDTTSSIHDELIILLSQHGCNSSAYWHTICLFSSRWEVAAITLLLGISLRSQDTFHTAAVSEIAVLLLGESDNPFSQRFSPPNLGVIASDSLWSSAYWSTICLFSFRWQVAINCLWDWDIPEDINNFHTSGRRRDRCLRIESQRFSPQNLE